LNAAVQARLLVAAQFGAIGVWAWQGPWLAPSPWLLAIQAAGVSLGVWAAGWMSLHQRGLFSVSPLPDRHQALVTDGPYRWIRHPMYTAVLAAVLPAALSGPPLASVAGCALILVLVIKYRFEDSLLARRFPGYDGYRRRTGALLPWLR
jgi:protein-S-isoprenylcysteine O-methyltransferase Ste14